MKEEVSFMPRQVGDVWSPSQAAAHREAKRRPAFYTYMNLWPFVGITVVLLMMFLMGVMPIYSPSAPVDLPSSSHATAQPKARAEDAMKIYVTRDGRVFFRTDRVRPESLPILIRGAVREGAERKVYLAVDSRARYGDVAAVVEQIGKAGIREICFLAYTRESDLEKSKRRP